MDNENRKHFRDIEPQALLLNLLFFGLYVILVLTFVLKGMESGKALVSVSLLALGILYGAALVHKMQRGGQPLKRVVPWLVLVAFACLGYGASYQVEDLTYEEVEVSRSWDEHPFTIYGIKPGMSRSEVIEVLGEPTGPAWLYKTKPTYLGPRSCANMVKRLVEAAKSSPEGVWTFPEEEKSALDERLEGLKIITRDLGEPEIEPFDPEDVSDSYYLKAFSEGLSVFTWLGENGYKELQEALEARLEDLEGKTLSIFVLWPLEEPLHNDHQGLYGVMYKSRRTAMEAFREPGVLVRFDPATDRVALVHGDTLTYGERVIASVHHRYRRPPPDWPEGEWKKTYPFGKHPSDLLGHSHTYEVVVSGQQLGLEVYRGKIRSVSLRPPVEADD